MKQHLRKTMPAIRGKSMSLIVINTIQNSPEARTALAGIPMDRPTAAPTPKASSGRGNTVKRMTIKKTLANPFAASNIDLPARWPIL